MNWNRVALYGLAFALIGACVGVGLALYTDESWLSEAEQSRLVQLRAFRTREIPDDGPRGEAEGSPSPSDHEESA